MAIEFKEDQTCPINESEISKVLNGSREDKLAIVDTILRLLDEKRDAYHGILHSIIHIINSRDENLIELMRDGLIKGIVSNPMAYGGRMFLNKVLYRLTLEEPSFVVGLFEQVVNKTNVWKNSFHDDKDILNIQVISLKAIRKAEGIDGSHSSTITLEEMNEICDKAINKCDDATKIDTLCFILESRKSTLPVEMRQLELFKIIFSDAIRLQKPALRQILLAQTNKLLIRIFASYKVVIRCTKIYTIQDGENLRHRYMQFLKWLTQFCLDSIYCHAYFGSFGLTISTLKSITELCETNGDDFDVIEILRTKRCYDTILCCINDSFEHNKILALDLMFSLPYNEEFISDKNIKCFEELAYKLVGSVNPSHSLTCQYLFKLIVGLRNKQPGCTQTKNQLIIVHLEKLVSIVEESVKETQDNFIYALKSKPIYPKLTCIRALLDDVEIKQIEQDRDKWQSIANKLVSLSIDACKAVSTIVCNLNPETIGHLPMDLKPIDISELAKALNVSLNISTNDLSTITSQMLLISGWKTIKECSLSMGALCNLFWWPKEPIRKKKIRNPGFATEPILEASHVVQIIDFFYHYLRNLRHRGAFEQAYNGFILVTKRVWYDQQFRDLLINTLEVIMKDFREEAQDDKKVEYLKAYVTRRSAGLPFIVKAILNSEFRQESKTLSWVLDSLFDILNDEHSKTYQKIHCLNILRALIKEHDLGEKVLPHVGKTISIAMKSFKSDSFPIRNCANMLLKVVVDRTFGVNRVRGDIHRRNQLSFEKFFHECPQLQTEMLDHLREGLNDKRCLATVHSVYIVLFRLTTTLDLDYDKFVEPLIEPILNLTFQCPDHKLRKLSAKLVVRLECFRDLEKTRSRESYYKDLLRPLVSELTRDINRLHGTILLIKYWVKRSEGFISFGQEMVKEVLLKENVPSTILDELMDLAETCCLRNHPTHNKWFLELKESIFKKIDQKEHLREPYFEGFVFKSMTTLLLNIFPHDCGSLHLTHDKDCHRIIDRMLRITRFIPRNRHYSSTLQASIIRFFRQLIYNSQQEHIDEVLEQLDMDLLSPHMTCFDRYLDETKSEREKKILLDYFRNESLRYYLMNLYDVGKIITEHLTGSYCEFEIPNDIANSPRAIELITLAYKDFRFESLDWQIEFFTKFPKRLPDCDIKCIEIMYAGKLIQMAIYNGRYKLYYIREYIKEFCKMVESLSEGDHSLTIRSSCSENLRLTLKPIIESKDPSLHASLKHLFVALSNLCQDEDSEIRSYSQNILICLRNYIPSESQNAGADRLKELIKLVATQVFDPNLEVDINNCVDLLLRFIFNNNSDHGNIQPEDDDQKDSLFDKSRLNDFADNVELVQSSLEALELFFKRRIDNKLVKLDSLRLFVDVLPNFKVIELHKLDNCKNNENLNLGTYNWYRKEMPSRAKVPITNHLYLDNLIKNIDKSLSYFDDGYGNMFLDTEYTYNELALYKNIAFVKFITEFTEHNLSNKHLLVSIRDQLRNIVTGSCSTTLLVRCLAIMERK